MRRIMIGLTTIVTLVAALSFTEAAQSTQPESVVSDVPGRADDAIVLTVWRNGKFHMAKLRTKSSLSVTPTGRVTEEVTTAASSPEEIEAQLPPIDPALAHLQPTAAEIQAMRARTDAESLRIQAAAGPPGPIPVGP